MVVSRVGFCGMNTLAFAEDWWQPASIVEFIAARATKSFMITAGKARGRSAPPARSTDGKAVKWQENSGAGAGVAGGTDLFRLYQVDDAIAWQARLAEAHIWSRIFPWSPTLIRLGLPAPDQWTRIEGAL